MIFSNYFLFILQKSRQLITPWVSILLIICFSNNALASSLSGYCLSEIKSAQPKPEDQNNVFYKPPKSSGLYEETSGLMTATFSRGKSKFVVETSGRDLQLKREGEQKVLQEQELGGFIKTDDWIRYLFITEDNWLFIRSEFNNYMIDLNTPTQSLGYGEPIKLPPIGDRCGKLKRWFNGGGCVVSSIYYSQTLNRAFISGYYPTDSGYIWTTIEILGGKIKTLSSPQKIFTVAADISQYNGAILRGTLNEVLFYDGNKIVELDLDLPRKWFSGEYPIWNVRSVNHYDEGEKNNTNQRVFITNTSIGTTNKVTKFIIELKKDTEIYTQKIIFSEEIDQKNLSLVLLSFPNEYRTWGATKNSILFEISGKYRTVLWIPKHYYIPDQLRTVDYQLREIARVRAEMPEGEKKKRFSLNEATIAFDVVNEKTEDSKTYYIKKTSPTANCEIMLNPDKPVLLQPESEINNHKQSKVNINKILNSLLKFFKVVN